MDGFQAQILVGPIRKEVEAIKTSLCDVSGSIGKRLDEVTVSLQGIVNSASGSVSNPEMQAGAQRPGSSGQNAVGTEECASAQDDKPVNARKRRPEREELTAFQHFLISYAYEHLEIPESMEDFTVGLINKWNDSSEEEVELCKSRVEKFNYTYHLNVKS